MKRFGLILLSLVVALSLAVPVMAEFDFYGTARVGTFYRDVEGADAGALAGPAGQLKDGDDLIWRQCNSSQFGAKATNGPVSGHVEFGLFGDQRENKVYTRLMYGTWKFDGATLLVGQAYSPYDFPANQTAAQFNSDDGGMVGFGRLYDARKPQIKVSWDNGFYVSAIQNETITSVTGYDIGAAVEEDVDGNLIDAVGKTEKTIPKIAVGYEGKVGKLAYGIGGAYNMFDLEGPYLDGEESVDSYLFYLHGKTNLNVVDVKFNLHYGQNLTNFGIKEREWAGALVSEDGDIEDTESYGGYVQGTFAAGEKSKVNVGIGYVTSDNDLYDEEDEQIAYFINMHIPVVAGFSVMPEVSYFDLMDDAMGVDQGNTLCAGLKWQMDF
jgi:hypothetical protein